MSWTVTENHLDHEQGENLFSGYGDVVGPDTKNAHRFHLFDDDGECYFSGWLVDDDACPYGLDAWSSVYDWGMGYAGTTTAKNGQMREIMK